MFSRSLSWTFLGLILDADAEPQAEKVTSLHHHMKNPQQHSFSIQLKMVKKKKLGLTLIPRIIAGGGAYSFAVSCH